MQFIFIFTLLIVSVYALASDDHDDLPVNNAPANSYANSHVATPKGDGEDHKKRGMLHDKELLDQLFKRLKAHSEGNAREHYGIKGDQDAEEIDETEPSDKKRGENKKHHKHSK